MALNDASTFIDSNVLLDIILPDRPRFELAERYVSGQQSTSISSLSVHLAVHFGRKFKLTPSDIMPTVEKLAILPVERSTVAWAFANVRDTDFEDALQIACALLNDCTTFITADERLMKRYGRIIDIQLLK